MYCCGGKCLCADVIVSAIVAVFLKLKMNVIGVFICLLFTSAYRDRHIYTLTVITLFQTTMGKTLSMKLHSYCKGETLLS